MRKDLRVVRKAAAIINDASESVVSDLLRLHDNRLTGREEEFTSQLKSELTLHLLDRIKDDLDRKVINGVRFEVYTFSKVEENDVGADILGLLEVNLGGKILRKGYLAQAKVGRVTNSNTDYPDVSCHSKLLLGQVENMLAISSSSYVFIYSEAGVSVVPALEVQQFNRSSINTKYFYQRKFGGFYEEFFKCFVGDHKLALPTNTPKDIVAFARENNLAQHKFLIRASIAAGETHQHR
jgi:hypothetical protein